MGRRIRNMTRSLRQWLSGDTNLILNHILMHLCLISSGGGRRSHRGRHAAGQPMTKETKFTIHADLCATIAAMCISFSFRFGGLHYLFSRLFVISCVLIIASFSLFYVASSLLTSAQAFHCTFSCPMPFSRAFLLLLLYTIRRWHHH